MFHDYLIPLYQWFLTGGARTPRGANLVPKGCEDTCEILKKCMFLPTFYIFSYIQNPGGARTDC